MAHPINHQQRQQQIHRSQPGPQKDTSDIEGFSKVGAAKKNLLSNALTDDSLGHSNPSASPKLNPITNTNTRHVANNPQNPHPPADSGSLKAKIDAQLATVTDTNKSTAKNLHQIKRKIDVLTHKLSKHEKTAAKKSHHKKGELLSLHSKSHALKHTHKQAVAWETVKAQQPSATIEDVSQQVKQKVIDKLDKKIQALDKELSRSNHAKTAAQAPRTPQQKRIALQIQSRTKRIQVKRQNIAEKNRTLSAIKYEIELIHENAHMNHMDIDEFSDEIWEQSDPIKDENGAITGYKTSVSVGEKLDILTEQLAAVEAEIDALSSECEALQNGSEKNGLSSLADLKKAVEPKTTKQKDSKLEKELETERTLLKGMRNALQSENFDSITDYNRMLDTAIKQMTASNKSQTSSTEHLVNESFNQFRALDSTHEQSQASYANIVFGNEFDDAKLSTAPKSKAPVRAQSPEKMVDLYLTLGDMLDEAFQEVKADAKQSDDLALKTALKHADNVSELEQFVEVAGEVDYASTTEGKEDYGTATYSADLQSDIDDLSKTTSMVKKRRHLATTSVKSYQNELTVLRKELSEATEQSQVSQKHQQELELLSSIMADHPTYSAKEVQQELDMQSKQTKHEIERLKQHVKNLESEEVFVESTPDPKLGSTKLAKKRLKTEKGKRKGSSMHFSGHKNPNNGQVFGTYQNVGKLSHAEDIYSCKQAIKSLEQKQGVISGASVRVQGFSQ